MILQWEPWTILNFTQTFFSSLYLFINMSAGYMDLRDADVISDLTSGSR
jgi:hypothetical protein